MTTIELKKSIIQRIAQIEDSTFLKAIKTIIDTNPSEAIFQIPDHIKKDVETGRNQVRKGNFLANDDLNAEITSWLKERK